MAAISLFLARKPPTVISTLPSAFPAPIIAPNPALPSPSWAQYTPQYNSHAHFFRTRYASRPPHMLRRLPLRATDILGLDSEAYAHVRSKNLPKAIPSPMKSRFFSLRFFPELHYISLFRKSTVSYTFTNRGTPDLNDTKLAQKMRSYSGKWRKHQFFNLSLLSPMDTAVGRSRYRKAVKRALFRCLRKVPEKDVARMAGVFYFRFIIMPACEKDLVEMEADIEAAVKTVLSNKGFLEKLRTVTITQNRTANKGRLLMKTVQTSNTLWAEKVPGYYPKLPFLGDTKKLL